jgi:hypothetical protein
MANTTGNRRWKEVSIWRRERERQRRRKQRTGVLKLRLGDAVDELSSEVASVVRGEELVARLLVDGVHDDLVDEGARLGDEASDTAREAKCQIRANKQRRKGKQDQPSLSREETASPHLVADNVRPHVLLHLCEVLRVGYVLENDTAVPLERSCEGFEVDFAGKVELGNLKGGSVDHGGRGRGQDEERAVKKKSEERRGGESVEGRQRRWRRCCFSSLYPPSPHRRSSASIGVPPITVRGGEGEARGAEAHPSSLSATRPSA